MTNLFVLLLLLVLLLLKFECINDLLLIVLLMLLFRYGEELSMSDKDLGMSHWLAGLRADFERANKHRLERPNYSCLCFDVAFLLLFFCLFSI